ncbi:uncharacterized protein LOC144660522 [Oculina patagonica]
MRALNAQICSFDHRVIIKHIVDEMDLRYIFLMLVVSLMANLTAGLSLCLGKHRPFNLQSVLYQEKGCGGGNLLKIHIDTQGKVPNGLCHARFDGLFRDDSNTKFTIKNVGGKKCIQFTEQGGTKYALKVINETSIAFEKRQCDNTARNEFLFDEQRINRTKYHIFKRTVNGNTTCLGVGGNCNRNLSFHRYSTDGAGVDRRCYFRKYKHRDCKK